MLRAHGRRRRQPGQRFEVLRLALLRDHVYGTAARGVRSMRERMRRELVKGGPGEFDLKQAAGGIADIEFLAPCWALRWAPRPSAGARVLRHHPPARVGGLGRPGARRDRPADRRLSAPTARGCRRTLDEERALVPASEFTLERAALAASGTHADAGG
ncbi:MAG: hypothetical protein U1F06_02010 [Steroidobacteraceae bacterium]